MAMALQQTELLHTDTRMARTYTCMRTGAAVNPAGYSYDVA